MNPEIDQIALNFSPESLGALNVIIGLIMFGVALELTTGDFVRLWKNPRPAITGILSQFLVLPALTFLLVTLWKPNPPTLALGLFLVAACPGGNTSNFISVLAKGNAALSVSLTAVSTLAAIVMTPFNFHFWGSMYGPTAEILKEIHIQPWDMFRTVLVLLGIPLAAGMATNHWFPKQAKMIMKPMRWFSLIAFAGFIVVALSNNYGFFVEHVGKIILLVCAHNALAFLGGYFLAKISGNTERNSRTISIETGIQNSGLALVITFDFFGGIGGMAIISAWWGLWHLFSGLALASVWARFAPEPQHSIENI